VRSTSRSAIFIPRDILSGHGAAADPADTAALRPKTTGRRKIK